MPGLCCVPHCNGRGGHAFPSNPELKKRWIQAVKRGEPNWRPTKWTTVCRAHFAESDYVMETREKEPARRRDLKPDTVPHVFSWKRPTGIASRSRSQRMTERKKVAEERSKLMDVTEIGAEVEVKAENVMNGVELEKETVEIPVCLLEAGTQTMSSGFSSATDFAFDSRRFHFYTGLENYDTFQTIFYCLGEAAFELNYFYDIVPSMLPEDQFYLTLMKLRLARTNYELGGMFGISEKEVSNIFITWVNFLYFHFKDIDWWPSRDLVQFYSPQDFKEKYPSTRVIVDGTEIPIKKPHQPILQQGTYSNYKNRNTAKVLVGVTPGGLVSYVSDVFGGAASDRQICERSTLLTQCDPGDSVMADKGFNVQDLFIPYQVHVNIPQFFARKNRMSNNSVLSDRKIASKRVHVERVIGLAKTFKILKHPLNGTESCLADAIISVCFYLCNFRSAIVPLDA